MPESSKGGAPEGASSSLKSFSGRKFDLMDAIAADPEVGSVNVHIAWLIIQALDQRTGAAAVTDKYLQSKLHKNRAACTKFRKRMAELGWFACIIGRSGRATVYIPQDERLRNLQNIALDRQIVEREHEGTAHQNTHNMKPRSAEKIGRFHNVQKTRPKERQCAENVTNSAEDPKHLHLMTHKRGLPIEDIASTRASEASDVPDHSWWTDEDWDARFDEIAGVLENDQGISRAAAETAARRIIAQQRRRDEPEAEAKDSAARLPASGGTRKSRRMAQNGS